MAELTNGAQAKRKAGGDEAPPATRTEMVTGFNTLDSGPSPADQSDGASPATMQEAKHENGPPASITCEPNVATLNFLPSRIMSEMLALQSSAGVEDGTGAGISQDSPHTSSSATSVEDLVPSRITSEMRDLEAEADAPHAQQVGVVQTNLFPTAVAVADDASSDGASFHDATSDILTQSLTIHGDDPLEHHLDPLLSLADSAKGIDLASSIKGMYRILDLVNEQGSGGFVDKIVIAQDSFGQFVNHISPGAYSSMTKVDFAALDGEHIKPIGLYGSKSELVRYLEKLEIIDSTTARMILNDSDHAASVTQEPLRSGVYLVDVPFHDVVYVVYWPENTTWDDDASDSVRRNRATFMRYLTKLCDQVVALISEPHASSLVWNDESQDSASEPDDEMDRMFAFQVSKTNEQEEDAAMLPGFSVHHSDVRAPRPAHGCPVDSSTLTPRMIPGEMASGFMKAEYLGPQSSSQPLHRQVDSHSLKETILSDPVRLEDLDDPALEILISHGLEHRVPHAVAEYRRRCDEIKGESTRWSKDARHAQSEQLLAHCPQMESEIRTSLGSEIAARFRTLSPEILAQAPESIPKAAADLRALYPGTDKSVSDITKGFAKDRKWHSITGDEFKGLKRQIVALVTHFEREPELDVTQQTALVDGKDITPRKKTAPVSSLHRVVSWFTTKVSGELSQHSRMPSASGLSDADFLAALPLWCQEWPALSAPADKAARSAQLSLSREADRYAHKEVKHWEEGYTAAIEHRIGREKESREHTAHREARYKLMADFNKLIDAGRDHCLVIKNVVARARRGEYDIYGTREMMLPATIKYNITELHLTAGDKHAMWEDDRFIPSPRLSERLSFTFQTPTAYNIFHAQFLPNQRFLLVVGNGHGEVGVIVEKYADLDHAVRSWRIKKPLNHDKIGSDCRVAFDETKRILAVCAVEKLQLHFFIFDDRYATLRGVGLTADLRPWYGPQQTITHIAFRSGNIEELAVVDDSARARIYSLATQQFRPAVLQLSSNPGAVLSAPDGSCLLCLEGGVLRAYHWASFGSSSGITLHGCDSSLNAVILTSFVKRSMMHCVWIDLSSHSVKSLALHVTHRITAFTFKEDHRRFGETSLARARTSHNCLIDCHADVWTRFPVVPAVSRQTVKAVEGRKDKAIIYVSDLGQLPFRKHHADLIAAFEKATRKPVDSVLSGVRVQGMTFSDLLTQPWSISSFQAGEWLVEVLCLIPIHIALARDNRFIPLKDGVLSSEAERALLGATVDQIADRLSFGWYESIFQSYMASKPVKVVSSMGEQSVGKSFALNHLVDTSFAGSAMRTTEGVWMSVAPTEEELIVALDFEGVHSIERSAQEDCLLVLFNAAISNLVLFRNNFALSRDITGLFQSFQSSSTVLDPAASPSLFQSTLVVIIKDVPEPDKHEVKNEFRHKFQRIVEVEQESNFVTRLHRGNLLIITWPVIESRQFYTLFPQVKKLLDKQPVTHPKAGIFLQTLKILMAKLKANDWGSLDQNMASHRVQQLLTVLPVAMRAGKAETEPEVEPLRDFDSGEIIDMVDSDAVFEVDYATSAAVSNATLLCLQESWPQFRNRHETLEQYWVDNLDMFVTGLAHDRIRHVEEWLASNMARFPPDSADFDSVRRHFDSLSVTLKANAEVCKLECALCHLLCLQRKNHEGPHGCGTDHRCRNDCHYVKEHEDSVICGLPAGHPGTHICNISQHLCGQTCDLFGKRGCLERCAKDWNHSEAGHHCPARYHGCGEACHLKDIRLPDGSLFSCREVCQIASNEEHTEHVCRVLSCPFRCQLCKRLCAASDHLHGLDPTAVHLCGEEHSCMKLCASTGICRIETTPQSVEATFVGRHETFQYTKYTQVSKRLKCAIVIPAWETEHAGEHVHSLDINAFHFCESRCNYCGYFCTLPLGHKQQEHETSHGSMARTKWAIEGESSVEVKDHRFASNDDGAPMLCSLVCRNIGRHVHIDFCRSEFAGGCQGVDLQHIDVDLQPDPARAKDYLSHSLYWRRSGFKDPYSQDEQADFAKCDSICAGPEHQTAENGAAATISFCTLPIFHVHHVQDPLTLVPAGYISADGHRFSCPNPALMQQLYHIIFIIDRSSSMGKTDRGPLQDTPVTHRIALTHNNRLGAVFSSLYAFWTARQARRAESHDTYSMIVFDSTAHHAIVNDHTSTPDELLQRVIPYSPGYGTNCETAVQAAQSCMESEWSDDRWPVIIFLSDGEAHLPEQAMRDLCRRAVQLGHPLSFHAVAFGPYARTLRQMVDIATQIHDSVERRADRRSSCSYSNALDTVELATTFLNIAETLRKTRGALMLA